MRSKRRNAVSVLVLALVYLLGVLLGAVSICYLPQWREKDKFLDIAAKQLDRYLVGEPIEEHLNFSQSVLVFSTDGELMLSASGGDGLPWGDYETHSKKYISRVAEAENGWFGVMFITRTKSESEAGRWLGSVSVLSVYGVPVYENGTVIAVLLLINLEILRFLIFEHFLWIYTAAICVIAAFMLYLMRRSKRLELIEQSYIDNITHELKSPIASVKALTIALNDQNLSQAEQSQYYGIILQEANRQERMVENILCLSKLRGCGKRLKAITAEELFGPVCSRYKLLCGNMDVDFIAGDELFLLPELFTDERLVWQLLDNLLGNALKFIGDDGVITLDANVENGRAVICVSDNGVGISEADLPHIFERFYRADRTSRTQGSGLGLAIANEIVLLLNEKIWVKSKLNEGSRFFFTLRLTGKASHRLQK